MIELDIIKQIEKDLNIKLENVEKEVYLKKGYAVNEAGKIIFIGLNDCKIENLNLLILYLKEFKHLKQLNLASNNLSDITPLKDLSRLTHLDLSSNQLIDISILKELKQLSDLDLQSNKVNDISCLCKLNQIEILKIGNNQIISISPLINLLKLTKLDSRRNKIRDISPLKELPNLKWLNSENNPIRDISPLTELSQLEYICLGNCEIKHLSPLKHLLNLKSLFLYKNLIDDIEVLSELQNLTEIHLGENNIANISSIKELKKLNRINLSDNIIENLPPWITEFELRIDLEKSKYGDNSINLHKNQIVNPPIEIVKRGKDAIKRYFKKINQEGIDYIYEAKLTFVGEGNSGKTSLQRRLLNNTSALPRKDLRTRGIAINDWEFKKNKGKRFIAHIWDFGGQDVYYPVHRFFLTENSVFVLLASTRQTHHNFDYWIPTIYQFGGKSPIILGQTCHDGNKVSWNDLGVYLSNQNFNIIKTDILPYHEINLPNKNEGLKKIKTTILNQIINLPHYGKGVPNSWIPVRDFLSIESKKNECISFEEFSYICRKINNESFNDINYIQDCCQFFHDIGVVIWYSGNDDLKNWVILQPEWAMNAVYKIIDDGEILNRKGIILAKDFKRLWKEDSYKDKQVILKKMLEIFKIAFPKKHKQEDYIIPARLISMPNEKKWQNNVPYLRLEFRYEFMPRGMVNQVSAELSRYIVNDEEVWNNAINFTYDNNSAHCQVEEDFFNRKINMRAKGKDARGLIILVMDSLKNISDGYKGVKPEIYVPCSCIICKANNRPVTFLYDDLLRWSENREHPRVVCNESGTSLLIEELLYNVGLSNQAKSNTPLIELSKQKNIFVSYSKFDVDYLQDFQDHLITLKDEGLVTFDCREIEFGKEWDKEIKQKIDECDIIVCLISVKFLNTDYIKKIEIQKAIEQNKIIIPIIIKACDWEPSALGKYQAAQRGKVVSLDNNQLLLGKIKGNSEEEKAAFWTAIIKEFRKKMFN